MKPRFLELAACPDCGDNLSLEPGAEVVREEVMEGQLACAGCLRTFIVARGIPRLLPLHLSADQSRTADAFGYEWLRFTELHREYEAQFLDWIHPLQPEFFRGRTVLDAGCGTGRHSYYAAAYGAEEVVGLDLSEAVETAYANVGERPNFHVVQGDIYNPPLKRDRFDFVYSIGVLHHLPDPRAGFESLIRFARPGGTMFAWVYGHENNGVVHYFINPLRKVLTARLPHAVTQALAWLLTVVMQVVIHGLYVPLRNSSIGARLPSRAYLLSLASFSFRQNYSIVFDHLVAPTAYYLREEEFRAWFTENRLEDIELSWRNENSWRGRGRRPVEVG